MSGRMTRMAGSVTRMPGWVTRIVGMGDSDHEGSSQATRLLRGWSSPKACPWLEEDFEDTDGSDTAEAVTGKSCCRKVQAIRKQGVCGRALELMRSFSGEVAESRSRQSRQVTLTPRISETEEDNRGQSAPQILARFASVSLKKSAA